MRSHKHSFCFRLWTIPAVLLMYVLPMLLATTATAQRSASNSGFKFKKIDSKSLGLWEGERPVLTYNFGEMRREGAPAAGTRSSYLHPIYGLDGEILTDDFPADHYHHHGLFWGWPHVRIGEREFDLWKMRGIRIEFQRWVAKVATADGAKLSFENGWFVRDKQVMKELVSFDAKPASAAGRNIDVSLTWTPVNEPITLGGAEGKSYGGVTLRFAPRTGTIITIPGGRASADLLIATLPWADLSAQFSGAPTTSGAALFVNPGNPGYPPEWMTRDYGVLAVGWPGVKPCTLQPGISISCRYRLWIHRGTPDATSIQTEYDAYARRHSAE